MSWVSGVASLFGNVASSAASAYNTQQTNQQNANLNSANMAFQERMRNTAMQSRVADLQKAGLNPILAAGSMGGAAQPSFSPIPMQQQSSAVAQGISGAMSSAASIRLTNAQAAKIESDTPDQPEVTRGVATQRSLQELRVVMSDNDVKQTTVDQINAAIANTKAKTFEQQSLNDNIQNIIGKQSADADIASLDLKLKQALVPLLIERARAEQPAAVGTGERAKAMQDSFWWQFIAPLVKPSGESRIGVPFLK